MKFKYYLRGAGIGVIAATVILSIAFLLQDSTTDAQVIQRALELGMVMDENGSGTLADISKQGSATDPETGADDQAGDKDPDDKDADKNAADKNADDKNTDDRTSDDEQDGDDQSSSDNERDGDDQPSSDNKSGGDDQPSGSKSDGDDKPSGGKSDGDDKKPGNADKPSSGNKVTVEIVGGDVSRTVSAKVFEAGLVDSADEFNDFLGDNDYDNQLQPGTYEIRKGASFREIAEILTAR